MLKDILWWIWLLPLIYFVFRFRREYWLLVLRLFIFWVGFSFGLEWVLVDKEDGKQGLGCPPGSNTHRSKRFHLFLLCPVWFGRDPCCGEVPVTTFPPTFWTNRARRSP